MATPIYSFLYPETEIRFFVIHNSYFELPETKNIEKKIIAVIPTISIFLDVVADAKYSKYSEYPQHPK